MVVTCHHHSVAANIQKFMQTQGKGLECNLTAPTHGMDLKLLHMTEVV